MAESNLVQCGAGPAGGTSGDTACLCASLLQLYNVHAIDARDLLSDSTKALSVLLVEAVAVYGQSRDE